MCDPLDAPRVEVVGVDEPMPGKLYQVQFRDRPADLARTIIRRSANVANPTAAQVDQYMHLLAAGSYNGELYGTHSHSNTYPDRWLVPGLGRGLRAAWLTRNLDALDCLLAESHCCAWSTDARERL